MCVYAISAVNTHFDIMTPAYESYKKFQMNLDLLKTADCLYCLSYSEFLKVANEGCKIHDKNCSDFNIVYDKQNDQIKYSDSDDWLTLDRPEGLIKIVEVTKKYYYDKYERFLIIQMELEKTNYWEKQQICEHLVEYYKFIGCFDKQLPIVACENNDNYDILNPADRHGKSGCYSIKDKYLPKYREAVESLSISAKATAHRGIFDNIKRTTKQNIQEYIARVKDLNADADFKQMILGKINA